MNRVETLALVRRWPFEPVTARPGLLVKPGELDRVRERAAARDGGTTFIRNAAEQHMQTPGEDASELQPYMSGAYGVVVAQAYAVTQDPAYAKWVKARTLALLEVNTWFAPVHEGVCRVCDHCIANVAAQVALCHDLLGDTWSDSETARIREGLVRKAFEPFLEGTSGQAEWWFHKGHRTNWKIMTCGEMGTALCGFAHDWPHAPEGIARALQGVLELLDEVPQEGDWNEGVGYWFHTLWMGLRFGRALQRVTGGQVDLFQHPVLQRTGDFMSKLTTPAGRVYNFNDCGPEVSSDMVETLAMLAHGTRRGDWMRTVRKLNMPTLITLACDDDDIASTEPDSRIARFPSAGAASMRTDWSDTSLFVGVKSGPSTAGHSHLDANGFVIEAGGIPLVIEYPYWPQAHFIGFFDAGGPRWTFDGPATIGHSTLLVDGVGQAHGAEHVGRIVSVEDHTSHMVTVADASTCYPGTLSKFVRTVAVIGSDTIVLRDVVNCVEPRHVEWLLQHAGDMRSVGAASVVEAEGMSLVVTPLLPSREGGWRESDVKRTSTYECSDTREMVTQAIQYRSFSPFPVAETFEFLFVLRVNGSTNGSDIAFDGSAGDWTLSLPAAKASVLPQDDTLVVQVGK